MEGNLTCRLPLVASWQLDGQQLFQADPKSLHSFELVNARCFPRIRVNHCCGSTVKDSPPSQYDHGQKHDSKWAYSVAPGHAEEHIPEYSRYVQENCRPTETILEFLNSLGIEDIVRNGVVARTAKRLLKLRVWLVVVHDTLAQHWCPGTVHPIVRHSAEI